MNRVEYSGAHAVVATGLLNDAEKKVFDFFTRHLKGAWEIYPHPFLNGLAPDFVLLNPEVGIAAFDVEENTPDADFGRKIDRVRRYRDEIIDLYCPRIQIRSGLEPVTCGLIFPNTETKVLMQTAAKNRFVHPLYLPVSGKQEFERGEIAKIFPGAGRKGSPAISDELASDLRSWLVEPDFQTLRRVPLELDKDQRRLVTTRTETGYRRIKGPAGSGKSVVLAARAAQLASEGKSVLVITYNITLMNYLRGLALRWDTPAPVINKGVTWLNFHHWCKRVMQESDSESEYNKMWQAHFDKDGDETSKNEVLKREMPALASKIIDGDVAGYIQRYDAIIVDEGQDFHPLWWQTLRKVLNPGGEMLLAADMTQDVYDTGQQWTDQVMAGAGFRAPWVRLRYSYRMPPNLVAKANQFAKRRLKRDNVDYPVSDQQPELNLYPCKMRWVQTSREKLVDCCTAEILKMPIHADPDILAIPDVVCICDLRKTGLQVARRIAAMKIGVAHTFGENDRRSKMSFMMDKAPVKITTLQSFKGWETRALVLCVERVRGYRSLAAIYAGITRVKRHDKGSYLTVVCSDPQLREDGRDWPEYAES